MTGVARAVTPRVLMKGHVVGSILFSTTSTLFHSGGPPPAGSVLPLALARSGRPGLAHVLARRQAPQEAGDTIQRVATGIIRRWLPSRLVGGCCSGAGRDKCPLTLLVRLPPLRWDPSEAGPGTDYGEPVKEPHQGCLGGDPSAPKLYVLQSPALEAADAPAVNGGNVEAPPPAPPRDPGQLGDVGQRNGRLLRQVDAHACEPPVMVANTHHSPPDP